jgi:Uma2 family endonuclease
MPVLVGSARSARAKSERQVPLLENGDRLTAAEFLRRVEFMPENRKIELIEGHVHMPPPLRADAHAEPDSLAQLWLGYYAAHTHGVKLYGNPTLLVDNDNTYQPDSVLCTAPRPGHRSWLTEKGYLAGSPELVCEIAASSASIDLHDKFNVYRRNGVTEYLVWVVGDEYIQWFALMNDGYIELQPKAGVLRSEVFKGLALDVKALLRRDGAKVLATLQRHMRR